ncbi:MAG: zinc ribbon domain-containing protein [Acidobacteriota bacterium]
MPLFEYRCSDCGNGFEFLVRGETEPVCPACRSQKVEKQLSVFAVGGSAPKAAAMPAGGPCGGCHNAGACGIAN